MTEAERIQQLTTNLQASLVLNNITKAAVAAQAAKTPKGVLSRIKAFFTK